MKNQGVALKLRSGGMDDNCGVEFRPPSLSEPISAVEREMPKRRDSDQHFFDGLGVIAPDSRETIEHLLYPAASSL